MWSWTDRWSTFLSTKKKCRRELTLSDGYRRRLYRRMKFHAQDAWELFSVLLYKSQWMLANIIYLVERTSICRYELVKIRWLAVGLQMLGCSAGLGDGWSIAAWQETLFEQRWREVVWDLGSLVPWFLIQPVNIVHAAKLWQQNSSSSEVSRKIKKNTLRVVRSLYEEYVLNKSPNKIFKEIWKGRTVGLDDPQRFLPTPNILWFFLNGD